MRMRRRGGSGASLVLLLFYIAVHSHVGGRRELVRRSCRCIAFVDADTFWGADIDGVRMPCARCAITQARSQAVPRVTHVRRNMDTSRHQP